MKDLILEGTAEEPAGTSPIKDGAGVLTEFLLYYAGYPPSGDDRTCTTAVAGIGQHLLAVTNAIKHGRPRRIDIGLASMPGRIVLTVRSNEVTFERIQTLKQGQRSIGLRIMSYRTRSIGGSLAFEAGGID